MKKIIAILILLIPILAAAGSNVQVPVKDATMNAYLAKPTGTGPFPALVVIHEWWGLNDQIKKTADRLAAEGYVALAVDLYRGKVATTPDEAHQFMSGLPEDRAIADMKAAFNHLAAMKEVKKERIGSIGWCMGGKYSFQLASHEPRIAAAVIYYGSVPSDSENLKAVTAPVIGFFGEKDQAVPPDVAKKFDQQMKALKKDVSIHIYPGAGHGFMNETGKAFHETAAKDAWTKTIAFLNKHLKK